MAPLALSLPYKLLAAPPHGWPRTHAHARILDARGCAGMRLSAHLWMSARERVLAAAPQWACGRQPHVAVQSCTTSVALPRGGAMPKALVYPSVQRLVSVGRCERCALAHTDACPESSSAARNSGPMGLDNVDYQRQLQILAASLPLAWMSLRARRRTVARSAVARFSADMEVITCAQHQKVCHSIRSMSNQARFF